MKIEIKICGHIDNLGRKNIETKNVGPENLGLRKPLVINFTTQIDATYQTNFQNVRIMPSFA